MGCALRPLFGAMFQHAMLELPAPIQFIDKRPRVAPTRLSLHVKFEKDPGSQHALNLQTRCGANLLQHPPALSHQNSLLSIPLTVDGCGNTREPVPLLEALHDDRSS